MSYHEAFLKTVLINGIKLFFVIVKHEYALNLDLFGGFKAVFKTFLAVLLEMLVGILTVIAISDNAASFTTKTTYQFIAQQ